MKVLAWEKLVFFKSVDRASFPKNQNILKKTKRKGTSPQAHTDLDHTILHHYIHLTCLKQRCCVEHQLGISLLEVAPCERKTAAGT